MWMVVYHVVSEDFFTGIFCIIWHGLHHFTVRLMYLYWASKVFNAVLNWFCVHVRGVLLAWWCIDDIFPNNREKRFMISYHRYMSGICKVMELFKTMKHSKQFSLNIVIILFCRCQTFRCICHWLQICRELNQNHYHLLFDLFLIGVVQFLVQLLKH